MNQPAIEVISSLVRLRRKPLVLWKPLRRLNLKATPLGPRYWLITLAVTRGAFDEGSADLHGFAFADEQDVELDFGVHLDVEFLDVELVAFLDAVLFTAGFDHCVGHGRMGKRLIHPRGRAGRSPRRLPAAQGFFMKNPSFREIDTDLLKTSGFFEVR